MNLSLRQATAADAPLISEMAQRIWRAHYTPFIGAEQVEYMLARIYEPDALRAQMQEGQVFWLPESEGKVLGYLALSQKEPGHYFLHKFYMDNEQRGLGLGKIILERLLAQYPDMKEMRLNVNRQNYKSVNFYFRVGFTIDFCLDTPFGDGYVMDDFQMLLKLNSQ
jgi:ribosomal protein S18 acetylase RimI-like enzyme